MTAILVPVYNEDPVATFARIAAMDASLRATGPGDRFHFAILSDTRSDEVAARERIWFLRLLADTHGEGRIFYRRRTQNKGRKAGNIEDFIKRAGAAYEFAIILDADSLMEGATMVEMVRRMEAAPDLGLLQTLPTIIRAKSRFGRTMQFAGAFYSPIFARGLAMMQGRTGPFWGHNAIVRVKAFAQSCGLPELSGRPPFGGHILSHDYVEAALLARAGWTVRVDDDLAGSYEEAPENIIDHAKRDRRWCQGNLQHARLIFAPGLKGLEPLCLCPRHPCLYRAGVLAGFSCRLHRGPAFRAARSTISPSTTGHFRCCRSVRCQRRCCWRLAWAGFCFCQSC